MHNSFLIYQSFVWWFSDLSSCSSSTAGPPTVSSSVESVTGECEMAPHSPARGGAGGAPPPSAPPPYAPPPPPYGPPPPTQWPHAPPNVYVSQVTANVNVHGYMGQYYQPHQPQYVPPPTERAPRHQHRRDRRGKRVPSPPPQQPPPYYVQYPHYYPPTQAQGAPLYHLPVYQPFVYGPYTYPQYYPEYQQIPVEGDTGDKGPEEYPAEVVMEQEAVDAYYAGAHYGAPQYGPPVDGAVEYIPPMYLPPPHHPPPMAMQHQPPHQTTPHQFNVHAKNFVLNQNQNKIYAHQDKSQHEQKTPPATASASATVSAIEALPIKDIKISQNKGPSSPKQAPVTESVQTKPTSPHDKVAPKVETPKPAWVPSEVKPAEPAAVSIIQVQSVVKTFPPVTVAAATSVNKIAPQLGKVTKGPAAPFSGVKQPPKPSVPPAAVPVQQAVSTPKAPFGNRQKRDGPMNRSPSSDNTAEPERAAPVEHPKREPPLPPSKAPMPISITLHAQGAPLIVTNKSPFSHSRKSVPVPEPTPAPQPPPPAPTASDFPPPPTPRNRGEPVPTPVVQQPQPAPGKSWASLFNKSTAQQITSTPAPAPVQPVEEPPSPTTVNPPAMQKPVAKVPPFDASPLQQTVVPDKSSPIPRVSVTTAPTISYSEKTSVNAVSNVPVVVKPASPQTTQEVREVPIVKEATPALPVQPSPFADDPNSYRMGGKQMFNALF